MNEGYPVNSGYTKLAGNAFSQAAMEPSFVALIREASRLQAALQQTQVQGVSRDDGRTPNSGQDIEIDPPAGSAKQHLWARSFLRSGLGPVIGALLAASLGAQRIDRRRNNYVWTFRDHRASLADQTGRAWTSSPDSRKVTRAAKVRAAFKRRRASDAPVFPESG